MFLVQYETNENEEAIVDDPVFNAAASTMADPGISWEFTGGDLYARDLITFTVVPEPAGWLLLIAGLLTLSYWRRGPNGRNPRTRRASRSASAVQANMV
jgi:hypothetical protein